jgi:hypothetical protein
VDIAFHTAETISPSAWLRAANSIREEINSGWLCIRPNIGSLLDIVVMIGKHPSAGFQAVI